MARRPAEPRSTRVQRLLQEARTLRREGRFGEAERRYRTAVRLHPDNLTALFNLGTLLQAMNRPAEAAKFLERALATNPPDAAVKTQLLEAIQAAHRAHKSAA
ncbi:MAG TPA: tetratricopeptide repeat protein [Burkholderiales bacterium]|jgi:Flp pilus assembly protein TadD|nr:tetratricopeptide repeat protein [Burkholderiales bacterium]